MTKEQVLKWLLAKLSDFAGWLGGWCKDNVDFAFILAVFTETPRWTVTFMAIHEPLWIGIPLGVLLAFATSKVWRHYFATRSLWSLSFNIASILLAVLVITPVLYAMTETQPHQVDVTTVFEDLQKVNGWRMAWAGGLALLTFIPLVQLAAVHGTQPSAKPTVTPLQTDIAPEQTERLEPATPAKPDIADRIAQLQGEGLEQPDIIDQLLGESYTGNAIAKALNINASTVSRRRNAAKRNGHNVAEVA